MAAFINQQSQKYIALDENVDGSVNNLRFNTQPKKVRYITKFSKSVSAH